MAVGTKILVAMRDWVESQLSKKVNLVDHERTTTSLLSPNLADGQHRCFAWSDLPPGAPDTQGTCWVITYIWDATNNRYWGDRIFRPANSTKTYINHCEVNVWSGWETIATDEPPQELELPLAAGYVTPAGSKCKYSKAQDGTVLVNLAVGHISGTLPTGYQIAATLPEGYRPADTVGRGTGGNYSISISADGNIQFIVPAQVTSLSEILEFRTS